ncbi:sugar ABC transporter permease [Nakamurella sp. A5-74]|uniref:Sugar ABC transporter permease n=1 Tax=Nakamurella sp. A5-74 TaxID=3158264 RepID=A0AAU8DK26_9ACTN
MVDTQRLSRTTRPWLLLAPALVVLGALLIWPLVRVVQLSLQDFTLSNLVSGEDNYIGFDNYTELLSSPLLWKTVLPNTVVFALVCVVGTVSLGTAVALLLNRLGPVWKWICSTAVMVAWAVPALTGTYVWVWLFDPLDGLVSHVLNALGLFDPSTTNWFTDRVSFYAIAALNVIHHGFPFVAITVLAGLVTVPSELYEAAEIDGANARKRFWSITVPILKPVFAVVTILSTIWDFKVFTQIYLMPGGSGGNDQVLNLGVWSYQQSFAQGEYGKGSAIAVLLTVLLLLITGVYLRTLFKEKEL